jgi:hypothetical protein
MLCEQCGAELEPEAQFCGMCGIKVESKLQRGAGNEEFSHPVADAQSRTGTGRDSRSIIGKGIQTHTAYISTYKTGRLLEASVARGGIVLKPKSLVDRYDEEWAKNILKEAREEDKRNPKSKEEDAAEERRLLPLCCLTFLCWNKSII